MYIIPHPLPYSWEKQKTKHKQKKYLEETTSLLFLSANSGVLTACHVSYERRWCLYSFSYVFLQHIKKNLKLQVVLLMEDEVQDDGEM